MYVLFMRTLLSANKTLAQVMEATRLPNRVNAQAAAQEKEEHMAQPVYGTADPESACICDELAGVDRYWRAANFRLLVKFIFSQQPSYEGRFLSRGR